MTNKWILPAAVLAVAGAAFFGSVTYAQAAQNGQSTIVQELSQKLGIDEQKVQTAFDEIRSERQQQRQAEFTERLNTAVADGKITEAQKNLILQKHEELQASREQEREELRDKTPEERRELMQQRHDEMQRWADANGFDLNLLGGPQGGPGGYRDMHGMMH